MASNLDKKRKSTAISNNNSNSNNSNNNSNSSYHKYNKTSSSSYSSTIQNPKRGGPGILLTCETGREYKARREALQILQQDWEIHITTTTTAKNTAGDITTTTTTTLPRNETLKKNTSDTQSLPSPSTPLAPPETSVSGSLDAEIALLQKQQSRTTGSSSSSSPDLPFVIYETGCKGTVLILYQSPNTTTRTTAPSFMTSTNNNESTTIVEQISSNNNGDIKTTSVEAGIQNESNLDTNRTVTDEIAKSVDNNNIIKVEWDPLVVVKRIVEDMTFKSPKYTSSRYISRMIPIQRTCYATIDDISVVVQSLLEPIVEMVAATRHSNTTNTTTLTTSLDPSNPSPRTKSTTFAIQEKRRFCNQMKRDALITAVGNVVGAVTKGYNNNNNDISTNTSNEWTVNLAQPDYTIWIDICKTVAGISIVPNLQSSYPKNFNLVEHRISLLNTEEPDFEDAEPHPSKTVTEDISQSSEMYSDDCKL